MPAVSFNVTQPRSLCAASQRRASGRCNAQMGQNIQQALGGAALSASVLSILGQPVSPALALSFKDMESMTYTQMKGTGLANTCPEIVVEGADPASVKSGSYEVHKMCMEPDKFEVNYDTKKGFVNTDVVTRLTYTLSDMEGTMNVGNGGAVDFKEREGMDFQPVTLQTPGGQRVPFLFTIKNLDSKGSLGPEGFKGPFQVPSYRGGSFLDPKMRGATLGYDSSVALMANPDNEELAKENIKTTLTLEGNADFKVTKYDPDTNEVAGTFVSVQPSDTDLGAKEPKDVRITGKWYAQL